MPMIIPCLIHSLLVSLIASKPAFAVLVSAHNVIQNDQAGDSEFWYDLVEQYKMVREIGITDDNIFVLYGDGNDFELSRSEFNSMKLFGHKISLGPPTRATLADVFSRIDKLMTRPGYLYVWWMSHGDPVGGSTDPCAMVLSLEYDDDRIEGSSLRDWMSEVTLAERKDLFVDACYSEGVIRAFKNSTGTTALSSASCDTTSSNLYQPCDGLPHSEFSFWQTTAILGDYTCWPQASADLNGDGRVSLSEIQAFARLMMKYSIPQIMDPQATSEKTFLDHSGPMR